MVKLVRSLGGQIANTLRDEILTGRLSEGELLQETALAQRFGVSRGPVRDAILELTKEGMLVEQGRSVVVAASPPDSIQSFVIPLRRTVESYAVGLLFMDIKDEHFAVWDEILERMRRACINADNAAIVEQDIALHRSFLEFSGQPDLLAIWTTIVARVRRFFIERCREYNDPMEQYAEHEQLITEFRLRDRSRAIRAIEEHISVSKS